MKNHLLDNIGHLSIRAERFYHGNSINTSSLHEYIDSKWS